MLSDRPPITQLQVFRLIIALRWVIIALVPLHAATYAATGPTGSAFWPAFGAAVIYLLVLSAFSARIFAFHQKGIAFVAIDMAVCFVLLVVGGDAGFWLFLLSTILLPGLYGTVTAGLVGAIAWNVLQIIGHLALGLPTSHTFSLTGLEDMFNITLIAVGWAYANGIVQGLERACAELKENRDALLVAHTDLDEREKQVLGLLNAGETLLSEHDRDRVLQIVVDALGEMGFGFCRIWLVEDEVFRPVFPADSYVAPVPEASAGALAVALERGRPMNAGAGHTYPVPGVSARVLAAVVPILSEDEAFGAMVVESISGEPFDDHEMELLALFAEQMALALEHLRFYEQTQEYAVADERARITTEIHDTVVQKLYGANLLAETLCEDTAGMPIAKVLGSVRETILGSLKDLRFAILRWDSLEWTDGLQGLVASYTREFGALVGMPVSVVARGEGRGLRQSSEKDMLWILQEALANVWRHARARSAQVDLDFDEGGVCLSVRDDGQGFDLTAASDGTGLPSIRSRGERANGTVSITSAPGSGTQVRVWIPG